MIVKKETNILRASVLLLMCTGLQSCIGAPPSANSQSPIISMGTDFNDDAVPVFFKNALANITLSKDSLTQRYGGTARLPEAIALFYSKLLNRKLNPDKEVIITVGATEALYSTIRALSSIGDEWIIIEPFYSAFEAQVKFANAVPRFTNLKPTKTSGIVTAEDWKLDRQEMKSLINHKTRGIIFNNPNNPVGKTYNRSDIEFIAQLAIDHNLYVISDEVHEFTTDTMIRIGTLPNMFERTVTIGSASKAFGIAGWRIGWAYGPANLIERIDEIHGEVVGFAAPPMAEAVAAIIEDEIKEFGTPQAFLARNLASVKRKRDFIVRAFRDAGMQPIVPSGGYCMLVGWLAFQNNNNIMKGLDFADWMSQTIRVMAFNAGKYYGEQHRYLGANQLRVCYHKRNSTLQAAAKNVLRLRSFESKRVGRNVML